MTDTKSADKAVRCVLENVPRVGFYNGTGSPEDDPFPSCVKSFVQYSEPDFALKGKELDQASAWHNVHIYLMGTSGAAFRLAWKRSKPSSEACNLASGLPDPAGCFERAFESVGYDCEMVLKKPYAEQLGIEQESEPAEAEFRKRIVESIRDRRRPVLAFGVIGPPECCIITGYDDSGDTLIGWNCFQDDKSFNAGVEIEPSGYFRKRNWFADTRGIILIGDKTKRPPLRDVYIESLEHALEIMRRPNARGFETGQAAFTAWADSLFIDSDFDVKDMPKLRELHTLTNIQGGTLAEARAWGSTFLRMAAEQLPEGADELGAAADCFSAEHDLVWAIWEFLRADGKDDNDQKRFAENITRRWRIAPLIYQARDHDARAAEHIEKALALAGAKPKPAGGRVVLEGVPRIGFDLNLCPLPGSVKAIMDYLCAPCDYDYVMAVSGAAFRRLWNRDDGGNVDLMYFSPEPHRRLFEAIGFETHSVPNTNKAEMISAVKQSISRGRPLIGFGVVGPPEAGIITGYERDGEVLLGWSYFQDPSVKGYFRREDWFEKMERGSSCGVISVGNRKSYNPAELETLVSTLEWAIDLTRKPTRPNIKDHSSGLAAYDDWAKGLEIDADYPIDDEKKLARRLMVHGDQCTMLGDRHSAAVYLRSMVGVAPSVADDLNAAAALYDKVTEQMGGVWPWSCDMSIETARALADHHMRVKIAKAVREARGHEAQAIEQIEKAVAKLRAEAGTPPSAAK